MMKVRNSGHSAFAAVSKTVSGGFPLTRVRIPPPPFFRRIWLVYRRNGPGGLLGLTQGRRVNERPQTPLLADFVPPPFPPRACSQARRPGHRPPLRVGSRRPPKRV